MLDWGRVVESLNKLDAGVPEQVSLMSRDEASLLVRPHTSHAQHRVLCMLSGPVLVLA